MLFDSEKRIDLSPQQRRTGLMFQNYALFPNMTLLQNIRAGARRERDAAAREKKVLEIMDSFGLSELAAHYPRQLSGGQQQRTALARLLVSAPDILLLDEPFSALDSHLRFRLERELAEVIRDFGRTVILVSHDRDEVFRLSDKIAVMNEGGIETCGEKKAVFARPATRSAAILTGCKNISPIEKLGPRRLLALDWGMELETAEDIGEARYLGIRMHDLCFGPGENAFLCRLLSETENPFSYTLMFVRGSAGPVGLETDKGTWERLRCGETYIRLPPEKCVLLK